MNDYDCCTVAPLGISLSQGTRLRNNHIYSSESGEEHCMIDWKALMKPKYDEKSPLACKSAWLREGPTILASKVHGLEGTSKLPKNTGQTHICSVYHGLVRKRTETCFTEMISLEKALDTE